MADPRLDFAWRKISQSLKIFLGQRSVARPARKIGRGIELKTATRKQSKGNWIKTTSQLQTTVAEMSFGAFLVNHKTRTIYVLSGQRMALLKSLYTINFFGARFSPCAIFVLQNCANDHKQEYPEAYTSIL